MSTKSEIENENENENENKTEIVNTSENFLHSIRNVCVSENQTLS